MSIVENVLADNETSISCNTIQEVVSILKHASVTTEEAKCFDLLISKDKTNTDTTGSELNYFIPLSHPSEDEENASELMEWLEEAELSNAFPYLKGKFAFCLWVRNKC